MTNEERTIMKQLNIAKLLLGAVATLAFAACEDTDYQLYDTGQKDSAYIEYIDENDQEATSVDYNFGFDPRTSYVVGLPVKLMGMTSAQDRPFTLEVAEGTTMQEGVHYEIDREAMYIPADGVENIVPITLLRENDPQLLTQEFTLKLRLVPSEALDVVGTDTFTITYSDIHPDVAPDWWVGGIQTYSICQYRYETAVKFFELFYAMEEVNPTVVHEMTDRYGDYFVNATSLQGPLAMYLPFLNKYVLSPLWDWVNENYPEDLVLVPPFISWQKPTSF